MTSRGTFTEHWEAVWADRGQTKYILHQFVSRQSGIREADRMPKNRKQVRAVFTAFLDTYDRNRWPDDGCAHADRVPVGEELDEYGASFGSAEWNIYWSDLTREQQSRLTEIRARYFSNRIVKAALS